MAETITMPKLGFDMAEGTLVRWVIQEGDEVQKGQVLAEIETDKATVEVESTHSGVIHRHLVSEGDSVPVGEPIAVVGEPGEEIGEAPAAKKETAEPEEPSKEEIAEAGEGAPGAFTPKEVAQGEGPETETPAAVGRTEPKEEAAEAPARAEQPGDGQLPGGVRASPVARRIAEEKGVDLTKVQGSGPAGRIIKKDVEAFVEKAPEARPAEAGPKPAEPAEKPAKAPAGPVFAPLGPPLEDQEIPLNRLRAAIGRRMVESKQQAPHFYVTHEYDLAALMELRKQVNEMLPQEEKISVNDFIVKAVALALRQFPNLNASLQGDKVLQHGQVNIGVAVAVEGGLLTVVNRDTDRKPLRQIAAELRTSVDRARQGKVRPDDVEGSTFSISNMGMFDVEHFVAIINPPEAAILAVGSAKEVPVVKDGEIKPGLRMKATISVDHRVSDGAEAARFMQAVGQYLEQPLSLML
jgi:pyruvate dehydrogenase E2 component (dihydrolipoamide acetyltransferase)